MTLETQLLDFTTSDKETLHGLLFSPRERKSDLALLLVHGVAMNFYLPALPSFAQALAQQGYHCFVINTRGHDWINRAGGDLFDFCGATYEKFEDSAKDYDGALERLSSLGYTRFILVSHSLGCVKSLLYQGTRKRADVIGVISCSCPKQFYSARAAEQPEFTQVLEQAEAMVARGKGKSFSGRWRAALRRFFPPQRTSTSTASTRTTMCDRTRAALAARISPSPAAPSIRFSLNTRKRWRKRAAPAAATKSFQARIISITATNPR